jgi:hypothetical protein
MFLASGGSPTFCAWMAVIEAVTTTTSATPVTPGFQALKFVMGSLRSCVMAGLGPAMR